MKGVNLTQVLAKAQEFEALLQNRIEAIAQPISVLEKTQMVLQEQLPNEFAVLSESIVPEGVSINHVTAVRDAKNKLKERFSFESVYSRLVRLPLKQQFEPVAVGFGVVVTPETIERAILVIANSTILTTKQVMLKAILDVLQTLPEASQNKEFFFGHLGRIYAQLISQLQITEVDVKRLIILPTVTTISNMIVEGTADPADWGVSMLDVEVARKIFSDDEENLPLWLSYLKVFDLLGSAMLNLAIFEQQAGLTNAEPNPIGKL